MKDQENSVVINGITIRDEDLGVIKLLQTCKLIIESMPDDQSLPELPPLPEPDIPSECIFPMDLVYGPKSLIYRRI